MMGWDHPCDAVCCLSWLHNCLQTFTVWTTCTPIGDTRYRFPFLSLKISKIKSLAVIWAHLESPPTFTEYIPNLTWRHPSFFSLVDTLIFLILSIKTIFRLVTIGKKCSLSHLDRLCPLSVCVVTFLSFSCILFIFSASLHNRIWARRAVIGPTPPDSSLATAATVPSIHPRSMQYYL